MFDVFKQNDHILHLLIFKAQPVKMLNTHVNTQWKNMFEVMYILSVEGIYIIPKGKFVGQPTVITLQSRSNNWNAKRKNNNKFRENIIIKSCHNILRRPFKRPMAAWTNEFLSLLVLHLGRMYLWQMEAVGQWVAEISQDWLGLLQSPHLVPCSLYLFWG